MTAKTIATDKIYHKLLSLDITDCGYDIRDYNVEKRSNELEISFAISRGLYKDSIEYVENEEEFEEVIEDFINENKIDISAKVEVKTQEVEVKVEVEPDSIDHGPLVLAGAYVRISISYDSEKEVNWDIVLAEVINILNSVLKL